MKNLYERKQWINYRLKAQSRHGVHSPFAYHFSEKILYKKSRKQLRQRISDYFKEYDIRWNDWNFKTVNENTVVILENIHQTQNSLEAWNQLLAKPEVKLSLDVFDFGILLFKKDFLAKQHFVLK